MTPEKFIQIWTENDLTERAGAQPFIEDLCELLQLEKPRNSDDFCYEKGAIKDSGKMVGRTFGNATILVGKTKNRNLTLLKP